LMCLFIVMIFRASGNTANSMNNTNDWHSWFGVDIRFE
jgi:hypothetical protein